MSKEKDFDKAVSLLGEHVTNNVTKLTPKELKVPLLFRLDENVPKTFIPRMPASAASSENNTVARVVTATTIFGCMSGNAQMLWLVLDRRIGESGNNHYKLTAFDFDFALLPNKKLVYDAEDTKEAWLIAYDQNTISYKPWHYGELFFHKVSVIVNGNSKINKRIAEFLIHITDQRGAPFTEGIFLEKGYYYIKADVSRYALPGMKGAPQRLTVSDDSYFEIMPVSASVYKSFRDISVTKKGR